MRIKKTSATTSIQAQVVNTYNTSDSDTYSCDYINGVRLYENSTGTNGNITLSDSVTNYEYVELYYYYNHWAGKIYSSTKIDNPNTKILSIGNELQYQDNGNMYYSWARITFNGSTLELIRAGTGTTVDDGSSNDNNNQIYIYKVIGYKGNTTSSNTRNLQESKKSISEEEVKEPIEDEKK